MTTADRRGACAEFLNLAYRSALAALADGESKAPMVPAYRGNPYVRAAAIQKQLHSEQSASHRIFRAPARGAKT